MSRSVRGGLRLCFARDMRKDGESDRDYEGRAMTISRRTFLCGAAAGFAVGAPAAWLGTRASPKLQPCHTPAPAVSVADGMPGPFPGRVVEVHSPAAVGSDFTIDANVVADMTRRGMCTLTGADHHTEAWKKLFQKGDVVGIKVNPVGQSTGKGKPGAISSPAMVVEVVEGLKSAGVRPQDIILFERYAKQFREAGYERLLGARPMQGVRWYASAYEYNDIQLDIEGFDNWPRDSKVIGYDPDVFFSAGYAHPDPDIHHPKDDRRFRSHLSLVVSRMVNKVINLPVLKDHGSGGVTLALKNMSHGMFNNVARSHLPQHVRGDTKHGPNQCNTFIPTGASLPLVRQKVVLHILDGLIGVWQGGPSSWHGNVWAHGSLFFATDPVAMDHIGWEIVDAKRVEKGLPVVAETGIQGKNPTGREGLDRRQPEHILLAESVGLGIFDKGRIDYRKIDMTVT
jgi:Domain of unknown function (DUF362)